MIQPTVNGYLTKLSASAVLRDKKLAKTNIDRSIASIKTRLNLNHRSVIDEQFIFGSYRRKTILPRFMDANSDVDYMVVFSDSDLRPQTYLDRLRKFVEKTYPKTLIKQDHPAIRLDLNHIRFELVPAIRGRRGLQIPARASDYEDWTDTDPNDFIVELVRKNKEHGNRIRPLVRLVKYWNACNGYPFESFKLEKEIVECSYSGGFFRAAPESLRDYFYEFMNQLDGDWNDAQWKNDVVSRAQRTIKTSKAFEADDEQKAAISELQKVLPPVSVERK